MIKVREATTTSMSGLLTINSAQASPQVGTQAEPAIGCLALVGTDKGSNRVDSSKRLDSPSSYCVNSTKPDRTMDCFQHVVLLIKQLCRIATPARSAACL